MAQVDKALRPGGHFVFADFRSVEAIPQLEEDLESGSLKIIKKEDITINVLHALKLDEKRRKNLIEGNVNKLLRPFFRKFSGLKGTRINQEFASRQTVYMAYVLEKQGA